MRVWGTRAYLIEREEILAAIERNRANLMRMKRGTGIAARRPTNWIPIIRSGFRSYLLLRSSLRLAGIAWRITIRPWGLPLLAAGFGAWKLLSGNIPSGSPRLSRPPEFPSNPGS